MSGVDADQADVASLPWLGERRSQPAWRDTEAERPIGQASGVHRAGRERLCSVEQQLLCALVIPAGVSGPRSRADDGGKLMRERAIVAETRIAPIQGRADRVSVIAAASNDGGEETR